MSTSKDWYYSTTQKGAEMVTLPGSERYNRAASARRVAAHADTPPVLPKPWRSIVLW